MTAEETIGDAPMGDRQDDGGSGDGSSKQN